MMFHANLRAFLPIVLLLLATGCATKRDLMVRSNPADATVSINGRSVGTTPHKAPFRWEDDEDEADVVVSKDGYEPVSRRVSRSTARSGKGPIEINVDLEPLLRSEKLLINSNVEKATVKIDGTEVGQTPVVAELRFTREDPSQPWSSFDLEVSKDKYQYVPASGSALPAFATTVTLNTVKNGKLIVPLEPIKYYLTTVRRFLVEKEGIRTEAETTPSRIGEIEREPKASAVTQITDADPQAPLIETRVSPAPDSSIIACSIPIWEAGSKEPVGSSIWMRRGAQATRMTDGRFFDVEPHVSADGKWVYFASNRLGRMTIWRISSTGRGGLQKVTDSPSAVVDNEPSLSPDGSRLAYTSMLPGSDRPQVWLANPDGTLPTQIREGRSPAWSPDNERIAYVAEDGLTGNDCIWVMGADGGNPTRLTSPDMISRHPSWTPDGKIVFSCNRGLNDQQQRNFDIWMMNGDGSGQTQLTVNGSYDARPAVTADNKYLYFISNRGAQKEGDDSLQIWRITF
jgi:hypothetical protein